MKFWETKQKEIKTVLNSWGKKFSPSFLFSQLSPPFCASATLCKTVMHSRTDYTTTAQGSVTSAMLTGEGTEWAALESFHISLVAREVWLCCAPKYPDMFLKVRMESNILDIWFSSVKEPSPKKNKQRKRTKKAFFKSKKQNKNKQTNKEAGTKLKAKPTKQTPHNSLSRSLLAKSGRWTCLEI